MTDPELQALAEQMAEALSIPPGRANDVPLPDRMVHYLEAANECAQVAVDFFADRLARADAIETAAREVAVAVTAIAAGGDDDHRAVAFTLLGVAGVRLRAALEAS